MTQSQTGKVVLMISLGILATQSASANPFLGIIPTPRAQPSVYVGNPLIPPMFAREAAYEAQTTRVRFVPEGESRPRKLSSDADEFIKSTDKTLNSKDPNQYWVHAPGTVSYLSEHVSASPHLPGGKTKQAWLTQTALDQGSGDLVKYEFPLSQYGGKVSMTQKHFPNVDGSLTPLAEINYQLGPNRITEKIQTRMDGRAIPWMTELVMRNAGDAIVFKAARVGGDNRSLMVGIGNAKETKLTIPEGEGSTKYGSIMRWEIDHRTFEMTIYTTSGLKLYRAIGRPQNDRFLEKDLIFRPFKEAEKVTNNELNRVHAANSTFRGLSDVSDANRTVIDMDQKAGLSR